MTQIDITDGTRTTFAATFVSKRVLEVGGQRSTRLRFVVDGEESIPAFVAPSRTAAVVGLRTGDAYRVADALGCVPPTAMAELPRPCPVCGGRLREGSTLDGVDDALREAVDAFDVGGPFLAVDERTTLVALGEGDRRREENRPRAERWGPRGDGLTAPDAPDAVCRACGEVFDANDLADGGTPAQPDCD